MDGGQQAGEQLLDGEALGQCLVGRHKPMAQHIGGDIEDVLRQGIGATAHECQRSSGGHEAEGGAGAGAPHDEFGEFGKAVRRRFAGGEHQANGVVGNRGSDLYGVGGLLQTHEVVERQHLLGTGSLAAHPGHDLGLLGGGRVADHDLHEEAIALRLGQRVHALALDGVLGGQHEERLGHLLGDTGDRDLMLGHDLEQRRLHLRRRTVDLVGQHDVGEHRAPFDVEGLVGGAEDARADEIGGQQIGGELQAVERAADDRGERLDRQCLGQTGHTFEQYMAAGDEADEQTLDGPVLAHDHLLHLEQRRLEQRRLAGGTIGGDRRLARDDVLAGCARRSARVHRVRLVRGWDGVEIGGQGHARLLGAERTGRCDGARDRGARRGISRRTMAGKHIVPKISIKTLNGRVRRTGLRGFAPRWGRAVMPAAPGPPGSPVSGRGGA